MSIKNIIELVKREEAKTNPCWEWQGTKVNGGYGISSSGTGRSRLVHREVYEFIHGPTDLLVLHRCDNPLCVSPFHLVAGDQSLNMKHMYRRGRRLTRRKIRHSYIPITTVKQQTNQQNQK